MQPQACISKFQVKIKQNKQDSDNASSQQTTNTQKDKTTLIDSPK